MRPNAMLLLVRAYRGGIALPLWHADQDMHRNCQLLFKATQEPKRRDAANSRIMRRILRTLRVRFKLAKIGVFSLGRFEKLQFSRLKIAGKRVEIRFLPGEQDVFRETLIEIYLRDDYGIEGLNPPPKFVLDIGANVGCFSLVARHYFPKATIHAYEPNPVLAPILRNNLDSLGIQYFAEAVGRRTAAVRFESSSSGSLYGKVKPSPNGRVSMVAIQQAIERLGGRVDLLKLDCEGSEWEILSDSDALQRVMCIRMEYHLHGRPESSLAQLHGMLAGQGFKVTCSCPSAHADGQQGLMWAQRPQLDSRSG